MPAPSTLPKDALTVRYPPNEDVEESYQLLELPPEILKAVEGGESVGLTIKGRPSDDAVLCTHNKTYTLRTVSVSNSLLVLRPPNDTTLHLRDTCHEVLECVPSAGRVERIRTVLRESAWSGIAAGGLKRKRTKRYTRAQLESIIQACDAELELGLKAHNVVEVDGHMLLLPPEKLGPLLSLVLALITVHRLDKRCPVKNLCEALYVDHEVPSDLTRGVMSLFGNIDEETWEYDPQGLVRELGRGLLVTLKQPRPEDQFLHDWRAAATDDFADYVDLSLLVGDYLLSDPPPSAFHSSAKLVTYFPVHALPMHTATRFSDLFLTRQRWRPDDMIPYLQGLYPAGDTKARDKLVAKFIRVVKGKDGTFWHARRSG